MGDAGHTPRDVRLIVGAVGLSSLGDFLLWIPLTLHLREMTDSGFAVAIVQGVGLGLPTAWLVIWFAGAMWFVGGLGHGVKNVLARTLIQERVAGRLHGRAFAAYNGIRNGSELVALTTGGLLIATIGARSTVALAGAIPALIGVVGLLLYRREAGVEPPGEGAVGAPGESVVEPAPVPAGGAVE